MFNEVSYSNHVGLSGKARRIREGTYIPAPVDPGQKPVLTPPAYSGPPIKVNPDGTSTTAPPGMPGAATEDMGFSLPNKIFGIQTSYVLLGGAALVALMMFGKRGR